MERDAPGDGSRARLLTMKIKDLFQEIEGLEPGRRFDLEITNLSQDSRTLRPGALFVAIEGSQVDGHRHIAEAIKNGAIAVVGQEALEGIGVPYWKVANSRRALAQLAAAWNGYPARNLVMIGVTGTDGKTTTINLIYQILQTVGLGAGMVSSVNAVIADEVQDTGFHVTTPDPLQVQSMLARMVNRGLSHCVLEATSQGLEQERVTNCEFDVAVMTNITHDHLDYHGSFEAYREAKTILFERLMENAEKEAFPHKVAVLNRDDPSYAHIQERSTCTRYLSYGLSAAADFRAIEVECNRAGIQFRVVSEGTDLQIRSPLLGEHNVFNCLAAFCTAVGGLGVKPQAATRGISDLSYIPGRMERIELGQPFLVFVDFAHTSNSLRQALKTTRTLTEGRVISVFGSAGLRDRKKRPEMGRISASLADLTILTAEDPRSESLPTILSEIAEGALAQGAVEGQTLWRIPDRGEALRFAVSIAKAGDTVIAFGKGHEQSMCFGDTEYPWDDRLAMRSVLSKLLGVKGPDLPRLPTSD